MNSIIKTIITFLFICTSIKAQRGAEIGAWVGAAHYFGDLNNLYRLNEPGLAAGGIFRFNLNNRISPQIMLNYSRIRGNDAKSSNSFDVRRNLKFYSDIIELAPSISFNYFPYIHGKQDYTVTPHMIMGLSIFYHDPKRKFNGEVYQLRSVGTEGQLAGQEYGTISLAWLLGFGVKFDLNYRWSINIDLDARFAVTDYLDDVSTVYPDVNALLNAKGPAAAFLSDPSITNMDQQKIGQKGFQRGDSKDRDMFATVGIGLLYYFGRLSCPPLAYAGN